MSDETSLISVEGERVPLSVSMAPMMDIAAAAARWQSIRDFADQVLIEGIDFGVIPGTRTGKVLLKPGAEKLCALFGFAVSFEVVGLLEDWANGVFYYRYRATITQGGEIIADSEGSCNSKEKKYRYRTEERTCPSCGMNTIIKGKEEYGGGWLCWAKKGGCGVKFKDGDLTIEGQAQGQVENGEPYDLINTIQKMAQKRAMIAAVLIAVGASEMFTQDLEPLPPSTTRGLPEGTGPTDDRPYPPEGTRAIDVYNDLQKPPSPPENPPGLSPTSRTKLREPIAPGDLMAILDKKVRALTSEAPHPAMQPSYVAKMRNVIASHCALILKLTPGPDLPGPDLVDTTIRSIFPELGLLHEVECLEAVASWLNPLVGIPATAELDDAALIVRKELVDLINFLNAEGCYDGY